ncbi:MarR family transcriptional regulator [Haliea sp. E1-2-M8]|uniref:MarR family winged helix-turn-helix transcriptional regulator n=1 Tax=Haliea sp. E1-2-M8 TaxID=3064706 RepID=UPI00271D193F|nr:MarR family transcriptional regulator [Haliea sp. E1-2-M8]MDO8863009.1 MarR family transcriptional regulator [Haliea sp. E1-2-M8]
MNPVLQRYQDNFPRHVLAITRQLESRIMESLVETHRHRGLRLSFEPYISLAASGGRRLSSIADNLGITRQAANAVVNELESLGYVRRAPDAEDGRAKQVILTAAGEKLRADGLQVAARLEAEYEVCLGAAQFEECRNALIAIVSPLPGNPPGVQAGMSTHLPEGRFTSLLPRLSDYMSRRLMDLTEARGHPGLKLSYAQVLTLIGKDGGRMQVMASAHKVSKQAINVIASELQKLGYIERRTDPRDARQVLLHFTPAGLEMIRDAVEAIDALEAELASPDSPAALPTLQDGMRQLYTRLQPEPHLNTGELQDLANSLLSRLGPDRAQQLGELLLNPTQ